MTGPEQGNNNVDKGDEMIQQLLALAEKTKNPQTTQSWSKELSWRWITQRAQGPSNRDSYNVRSTSSADSMKHTQEWVEKARELFKNLSSGGNVSKLDLKTALMLHNPNVDLQIPKTTCAKLWINTANLRLNTAQNAVIINSSDLLKRLG